MRSLLTVLAFLMTTLPCAAETTSVARPAVADAGPSGAGLSGSMTLRAQPGRIHVAVAGAITPALAEAFIQAMEAAPAGVPMTVELDSPGGFVKAGYAMIDAMLRQRASGRAVDTLVRGAATCESMCFGIFMAGAKRLADPGAWFMVHAPRDERTGTMTLKTTNEMIRRLVSLGTSERWIRLVAERGGFSGRVDYGMDAATLAAAGANAVTDLVAAP